ILIAHSGSVTCPCTAMINYITRAKIKIPSDDYVFRGVYRNTSGEYLKSQPLSYSRARELLREICIKIGLNPSEYGTHSLRAGGVTTASDNGVPQHRIKTHGRWRSDNAKNIYIR